MHFIDRRDAGMQLAKRLAAFKDEPSQIFALPRGGVPLGVEIAKQLQAPLDLIITRKIGHPLNPEYAIGALAENGKSFYNAAELGSSSKEWLENTESLLWNEIKRRRLKYGITQNHLASAKGKTAILVDDGVATGYTMLAAIHAVKDYQPQKIIVAIPIIPESMAQKLAELVDEVIALERTRHYRGAVGAYYDHFPQLTDEEVLEMLTELYPSVH